MEIDVMIKDGRKILLVDNNIFDVTDFKHPFNINPFDKKIGKNVKIDYNFHGKNSKKYGKNIKLVKSNHPGVRYVKNNNFITFNLFN